MLNFGMVSIVVVGGWGLEHWLLLVIIIIIIIIVSIITSWWFQPL